MIDTKKLIARAVAEAGEMFLGGAPTRTIEAAIARRYGRSRRSARRYLQLARAKLARAFTETDRGAIILRSERV
jgi:hypothetical protein